MKRSNADTEVAWIDAWGDLYELTHRFNSYWLVWPDGTGMDFDGLKHWLQQSAYQGYCVGLRHYHQRVSYGPRSTGSTATARASC